MADIPPIPATNPVAGTTPTAPAPPPSLLALPQAVANLSVGTLLNATVQSTDANGNTVLSTQNGQLTVASKVPLPSDSSLVLKVSANNVNSTNNTGNIFQARVVSVDGQPFNPPTAAAAPANAANTQTAAQATGAAGLNLNTINEDVQVNITNIQSNAAFNAPGSKSPGGNPGNAEGSGGPEPASPVAPAGFNPAGTAGTGGLDILRAVPPAVTTASGQATGTQAPTSPVNIDSAVSGLTHGDTVEGVLVAPAQNAGKFLSPAIAGNIPQTVAAVQGQGGAAAIPAQAGLLKASDTVTLKIVSAEFPEQNAAPTATNLPPVTPQNIASGQLPGIVISSEKTGEPLIKTPLGNIRLDTETALPKGTTLQLEILSVESNTASISITQEQSKLLAAGRANMSQAMNVLAAESPDVANKVLKEQIPQLDKNFAAKLFSFINNFKNSDSPSLLTNDSRRALQYAGQGQLLQKMEQDFSLAKQLVSDNHNNWNSLVFPLYDGKNLQYGVMHYKKEKGGDNSRESSGTKFVVEVDLTKLGPVQLEGEVANKSPAKEFNLMVRTKNRLSPDVQKGISDIFLEGAAVTGNNGMLQFVVDKGLSPAAFAPPQSGSANSFFA